MSFSYAYGANPQIDYVRLLIADTVDEGHIFEDSEIQMAANICSSGFITPSGGGQYLQQGAVSSPRFTAAILLESLASNKARLANSLRVLDITVDTKSAAADLRSQAKVLRESEMNDGSFAIVEQVVDQFAARERTWKQFLRLAS